jgi:hypothetical protein
MPSTSKLVNQELRWEKKREKETWYVLQQNGEEWVRERLVRSWGTLAEASAGKQAWTFKRAGLFHPHVTVRHTGEEDNVAMFTPSWTGKGYLEFTGGRILRWQSTKSFGREWAWIDHEQEILMRFQGSPGKMRTRFESAIRTEKDAALLAALGRYLIQLMTNDTIAMVAAAGAASTAS